MNRLLLTKRRSLLIPASENDPPEDKMDKTAPSGTAGRFFDKGEP